MHCSWLTVDTAIVAPYFAHYRWCKRVINLSHVFQGQTVGIKEVDDNVWLVSFMDYDLGYIDLEEKSLQPLENPFEAVKV